MSIDERINHVFVLVFENRSFDHMLGYSGITGNLPGTTISTKIDGIDPANPPSNPDTDGIIIKIDSTAPLTLPQNAKEPGHELPNVLVQLTGKPIGSDPVFNPYPSILNNQGFLLDYHTPSIPSAASNAVLECFDPNNLPVLNSLARRFTVCDQWYSSLPGPTWPNRFFIHAATSGGLDHSPSMTEIVGSYIKGYHFDHGTIFDSLHNANFTWNIYKAGNFALVQALKNIHGSDIREYKNFKNDLIQPDYPKYTFIEPNYGNFMFGNYRGGNSQHPLDGVLAGEQFLYDVYNTIFSSPIANHSILIVTYDEHGGFFDHKVPLTAIDPGDSKNYSNYGFSFKQYGVRVPAIVISPYIPSNQIDHTLYDHSSIPATLEKIFTLSPLTQRDKAANSLTNLVTLNSPLSMNIPGLNSPVLSAADSPKSITDIDPESIPEGDLPIEPMLAGFVAIACKTKLEHKHHNDLQNVPQEEINKELGQILTKKHALQYMKGVLTYISGSSS